MWLDSHPPFPNETRPPLTGGSGIQTSGRYKVPAAWPLRRRWPKSFWVGQRWFGPCRDEPTNEHFIAIFFGTKWLQKNWIKGKIFIWGWNGALKIEFGKLVFFGCFFLVGKFNHPDSHRLQVLFGVLLMKLSLTKPRDRLSTWTKTQDACHFAPFLAADL